MAVPEILHRIQGGEAGGGLLQETERISDG